MLTYQVFYYSFKCPKNGVYNITLEKCHVLVCILGPIRIWLCYQSEILSKQSFLEQMILYVYLPHMQETSEYYIFTYFKHTTEYHMLTYSYMHADILTYPHMQDTYSHMQNTSEYYILTYVNSQNTFGYYIFTFSKFQNTSEYHMLTYSHIHAEYILTLAVYI